MSLKERLTDPTKSLSGGKPCGIKVLMDSLPEDEREVLTGALRMDSGWGHTALKNILADEGHPVTVKIIERHRRKECTCGQA
jgi:hypothetical protein